MMIGKQLKNPWNILTKMPVLAGTELVDSEKIFEFRRK